MSDLDKKNFDANDLKDGKQRLREALLQVSEEYLEKVELAPKEDVWYSPKLEKNMAKLMKSRKRAWYKYFNTTCKRVSAACLASCVLIGALMSCRPIREPIVEFFKNAYEQFTEFWLPEETDTNAPCYIEEVHTLTYVPEGYEITEAPILSGKDFRIYTVWKNQENNRIIFSQMVLSMKVTLNTEVAISADYEDDETQILFIQRDGECHAFWNTENYSYSLVADGISEEEFMKIVKSLK